MREFSAAHKARCGGELPNFGEAGKLLKPLRIEHGHERLLAAWQAYLAATPTQWVTVRQFAAKPAQWLARACASSTKDPATMTAKERLMAKYGGGCAA